MIERLGHWLIDKELGRGGMGRVHLAHRHIKPQNLLRSDDGVVKLADFGVAKVFAGQHLTATGGLVGTAEFVSPEQAAGKPVTARSDLYSFGILLYTLVTGRVPFEGK